MATEELKEQIKNNLALKGCTEVTFVDFTDSHILVKFNCEELTSFILDLPGWEYGGIQANTGDDSILYKIEFKKV